MEEREPQEIHDANTDAGQEDREPEHPPGPPADVLARISGETNNAVGQGRVTSVPLQPRTIRNAQRRVIE